MKDIYPEQIAPSPTPMTILDEKIFILNEINIRYNSVLSKLYNINRRLVSENEECLPEKGKSEYIPNGTLGDLERLLNKNLETVLCMENEINLLSERI